MNATIGTLTRENLSQSVNDLVAEGGHALASDDKRVRTDANWNDRIAHLAPAVRTRLMDKYSITYNGRHYGRDSYLYDHLGDAVRYARIQHSANRNESGPRRRPESVETPNDSQRSLMTELGITFADGVYRFGAFRYERLSDAIDYAKLKGRVSVDPK